jgi:biopolymer transport protein TolR
MGAEIGAGQKSEPNVVPLCDILLVLLIIFMVITPTIQKGIDIKLPESSSMGGDSSKGIVLTVEKDESIKINKIPTNIDLLETELRTIFSTRVEKRIFVKADETLSYKYVLRVIDKVKGAGIDVVGLMTERYSSE